ncbi:MAG: T9SS type A sorting domain-containing protein [Sphingobacteriales bacterium JAD_PAG50586_3]|nr:MAG: T9SS type A sorting domain-containing protein [Sphingobacteriales bacterium JAD_PAG50586_3]
MKKHILLTTAAMATLFATTTKAQYTFSTFSSPYENLSNSTNLFPTTPNWDDEFLKIGVPFPVKVNGENYDSVMVESNGTLFFFNNFLDLNNIESETDTLMAVMPLGEYVSQNGATDLIARFDNSPISSKIEGTAPNRILKVEWRDAGFYSDTSNAQELYINLQAWYYEADGVFEFRYGARNFQPYVLNGFSGPVFGIAPLILSPVFDFATVGDIYVEGNAVAPAAANAYTTFTGLPNANQVFRFAPLGTAIAEDNALQFGLYPNPSTGLLFINPADANAYTIELFDQTGKAVVTQANLKGQQTVSLDGLANGLYMARITANGKQTTKRVLLAK